MLDAETLAQRQNANRQTMDREDFLKFSDMWEKISLEAIKGKATHILLYEEHSWFSDRNVVPAWFIDNALRFLGPARFKVQISSKLYSKCNMGRIHEGPGEISSVRRTVHISWSK